MAKFEFNRALRLSNEERKFKGELTRLEDPGPKFVAGYEGRLTNKQQVLFLVPAEYPFRPPRVLLPGLEHSNVHDGILCDGLARDTHGPHMGLLEWKRWLERLLDGLEDVEPCVHLKVKN
jgi:ubiquitin-protein ligase